MKYLVIWSLLLSFGCIKDNPDLDLIRAATEGNVSAVKEAISKKANVNARQEKTGISPLMLAISNDNEGVFYYLLENGADIHHKDRRGRTPIMWAAWKDRLKMAKELIERGANINERTKFKANALTFAKQHNNSEMIEFLKSQGATEDLVGE